jgi:hypothetical protein
MPDETVLYVLLTVEFSDRVFNQLIVTGPDTDDLPLTLQQYADTYEVDWMAALPVE